MINRISRWNDDAFSACMTWATNVQRTSVDVMIRTRTVTVQQDWRNYWKDNQTDKRRTIVKRVCSSTHTSAEGPDGTSATQLSQRPFKLRVATTLQKRRVQNHYTVNNRDRSLESIHNVPNFSLRIAEVLRHLFLTTLAAVNSKSADAIQLTREEMSLDGIFGLGGKFLDGGSCGNNAGVENSGKFSRWRHLWKQCWRS